MIKIEADYLKSLRWRANKIINLADKVIMFKRTNHLKHFDDIWADDIEDEFKDGKKAIDGIFEILSNVVEKQQFYTPDPDQDQTEISFLNLTIKNHKDTIKGIINDDLDAIESTLGAMKKSIFEETDDFVKKMTSQGEKK